VLSGEALLIVEGQERTCGSGTSCIVPQTIQDAARAFASGGMSRGTRGSDRGQETRQDSREVVLFVVRRSS
jgi:hypothetical protein